MRHLLLLALLSFLLSSCSLLTKEQTPFKKWWNEPQSISQIETEYDKFLSQLKSHPTASSSCINYSAEEDIKLSRGRLITVKRCNKLSSLEKESLDNEFQKYLQTLRLIHQPEWLQMKTEFTEDDELRTYSAPPFKGGFGIVLIREGKVIHIFEQNFK